MLSVEAADHFHVNACGEGQARGFLLIRCQPVFDQLLDRSVVADDKAIELPLAAQDLCQRKGISRGWHAIEIVEGAHECADAFVNGSFERRKVNLAQGSFRHVGSVVVAARFCGTVGDPVLCAGEDSIGRAVVASLKSAHARARHHRSQIGIFA